MIRTVTAVLAGMVASCNMSADSENHRSRQEEPAIIEVGEALPQQERCTAGLPPRLDSWEYAKYSVVVESLGSSLELLCLADGGEVLWPETTRLGDRACPVGTTPFFLQGTRPEELGLVLPPRPYGFGRPAKACGSY